MRKAYAGSAGLDPGDLATIKAANAATIPLASKLREQASAYERVSCYVETHWDSFPPDLQKLLTLIVYHSADEREKIWLRLDRYPAYARAIVSLIRLLANGDQYALVAFTTAQTRFRQAVLDAIERSHGEYQSEVQAALTPLRVSDSVAISPAEYMKRIRELSDTPV